MQCVCAKVLLLTEYDPWVGPAKLWLFYFIVVRNPIAIPDNPNIIP